MFLSVAEKLGCPKMELFQTVDLYEAKNMVQVIDALYSVSRSAAKKGFTGQLIGPKLAEKHVGYLLIGKGSLIFRRKAECRKEYNFFTNGIQWGCKRKWS